jgi:hypothetical protein
LAHRVRQSELVGESEDRLGVGRGDRRPDQVQAGGRVVEPAVDPQGLDEPLVRLVGRDPPDEQEHGGIPVVGGQSGALGRVHRTVDDLVVDQDRHHRRRPAAQLLELACVEGGVRDAEHRVGCQSGDLLTGQRHLGGRVLLPPLVIGLRGHIVIVEHQRLVPAEQELGHG